MKRNVRARRIGVWLLKHFGTVSSNEAALGDVLERFQQGQSRWWLWKQIAIVLALNLRGVGLGLVAGAVTGAVSIFENVRISDPGIGFFPDAVSPLVLVTIMYLMVRYWHRAGLRVEVIRRALLQAGIGAGFVAALSHYLLTVWWFHRRFPLSQLMKIALHIPEIGFFMVFFLVVLSGRVASRVFIRRQGRSS